MKKAFNQGRRRILEDMCLLVSHTLLGIKANEGRQVESQRLQKIASLNHYVCATSQKSLNKVCSLKKVVVILSVRHLQQSDILCSTETLLLPNECNNPPVTQLGERFKFKNQSIALLVYGLTNATVPSFFFK